MPKYVFKCKTCESSKSAFTSMDVKQIACTCGSQMDRQMPNISGQQVSEVIDPYTNTKRDQNHDDLIKNRRDDHYWNIEVPKLVKTHSTETCLENGWLVYNEKGELTVGKAPSKR